MTDLHGHVALVTGGGRGLGAATALALAEAGADVALLGRSEAALAAVAGAVRQRGREAAWETADVADWEGTSAAIARLAEALGTIDILVNNAAVVDAKGRLATLEPSVWARDMAINLNGPFYCARATLAGMLARGWGRIINVSSGAAIQPLTGAGAYSVSKAGMNHFTRALAAELKGSGVTPITVSPGMMDTDMQTDLRSTPGEDTEMFRRARVAGWLRPPEEPAALIRWLCGPEGEAFAGEVVNVGDPEIRGRVGLPEAPRR